MIRVSREFLKISSDLNQLSYIRSFGPAKQAVDLVVFYYFRFNIAKSNTHTRSSLLENSSKMKYSIASGLALVALAAAQSTTDCPATTATVTVVPTAVAYPVYISTYIAANTVININGDVYITVNNAPTTLVTTTTATSTVFSTVTAAPTPTATTIDAPIVLAINNNIATKNKRQTSFSGYLGAGAAVVDSCAAAQTLSLTDGQLFTTDGLQFSGSVGDGYIDFSASATVGDITTTFGIDGVFVWTNGNFTGGEAAFCLYEGTGPVMAGLDTSSAIYCTGITFSAILGKFLLFFANASSC